MKDLSAKRNSIRAAGFVLMIALVIMAIAGSAMLFLTSESNILMSETNHAYLLACRRNLITSGLA